MEIRSIETCPFCSKQINARDAFCSSCGESVRDICQVCSSVMDRGAKFCPACGVQATPAYVKCSKCGSRANSVVMTNCVACGTAFLPKCLACGSAVVGGWAHCRFCGREIGSPNGITRQAIERAHAEVARSKSSTDEIEDESVDDPADAYNAQGSDFYGEDRFEEAVEAFSKAVSLNPNKAAYRCNLALSLDEAGRKDEAQREYSRTLELNPNDTTALLYLGYLFNEQGDMDKAEELWRRLAKAAPGSPEAEEAMQNLNAQRNL